MKSEERQKLAKERREEKAKYLGKWGKGPAPYIGWELPLVLGWVAAATGAAYGRHM